MLYWEKQGNPSWCAPPQACVYTQPLLATDWRTEYMLHRLNPALFVDPTYPAPSIPGFLPQFLMLSNAILPGAQGSA